MVPRVAKAPSTALRRAAAVIAAVSCAITVAASERRPGASLVRTCTEASCAASWAKAASFWAASARAGSVPKAPTSAAASAGVFEARSPPAIAGRRARRQAVGNPATARGDRGQRPALQRIAPHSVRPLPCSPTPRWLRGRHPAGIAWRRHRLALGEPLRVAAARVLARQPFRESLRPRTHPVRRAGWRHSVRKLCSTVRSRVASLASPAAVAWPECPSASRAPACQPPLAPRKRFGPNLQRGADGCARPRPQQWLRAPRVRSLP